MTQPARRFRRWLMASGPGVAAAGWRMGALSAAAALLIWEVLGAAFFQPVPVPYVRRRRLKMPRLFLSSAVGSFALLGLAALWHPLLTRASANAALFWLGNAGFSLLLSQAAARLPLPAALCWLLGGLLCAGSLFMIL